MTDRRLHLCQSCCTEWVPSGQFHCPACSVAEPARKPVPLPGVLPSSAPADLGTE